MKRRRKIAFLIALLFALGAFVWLILSLVTTEPSYNGKRFTIWLDQYQKYFIARTDEEKENREAAEQALHQIGTNAIPTLLRMVAARDSGLKTKLKALLGQRRFHQLGFHDPDYYHAKATYGFGALGRDAKLAVPALINLLSDPNREVQAYAAQCLSLIGPEAKDAVPHLVRLLNDTGNGYGPVIMNSMQALGCIQSDPETVVPLLMEYVNGSNKDWNYNVSAMDALSLYREKAKSAIPALRELLEHADKSYRNAAARALGRIEPPEQREPIGTRR